MNMVKIILSLIFTLSLSLGAFADSPQIESAKAFMTKFQKLSHEYDSSMINLYSDEAKIIRDLIYSDGKTEKVVIPVKNYKNALKFFRIFAKIKGYKNYYKNLVYTTEGENVRITGLRENTNGYKTPISILLDTKNLKILEEETNTKSIFLVKKVLSK